MDEDKILKKWFRVTSHNNDQEIGKAYEEMRDLLDGMEKEKVEDYLSELDSWWDEQVEEIEEEHGGDSFAEILGKMTRYNQLIRSMYEQLFRFTNDTVKKEVEVEKL